MALYTIILKEDVVVDPRKYGDLLAPVLGVTKLEAKMAVKKGRGIFIEDIEEQHALKLAANLEQDGVGCWAVPNGDLPGLPAPRKVSHIERSSSAMRYRWAGDLEPTEIRWDHIAVVSLAAVALPEYKDQYAGIKFEHMPALHKMDEEPGIRELLRERVILKMSDSDTTVRTVGSPGSSRPKAEERSIFEELQKKHSKTLKVYADILASDRSVWMRVPMDEMAYVHDPGSIKFGESYGFNYLFQVLSTRCSKAMTAMSWRFVPNAEVGSLLFLTIEEFNKYTLWNAYRNQLCAKNDTSSPSPAPPAPPTDAGSSTS